jgi:hypothetical protein
MSLHPDHSYCPHCGGVMPIGSFGRKLKSCCTCTDEQLTECNSDPFLNRDAYLLVAGRKRARRAA